MRSRRRKYRSNPTGMQWGLIGIGVLAGGATLFTFMDGVGILDTDKNGNVPGPVSKSSWNDHENKRMQTRILGGIAAASGLGLLLLKPRGIGIILGGLLLAGYGAFSFIAPNGGVSDYKTPDGKTPQLTG